MQTKPVDMVGNNMGNIFASIGPTVIIVNGVNHKGSKLGVTYIKCISRFLPFFNASWIIEYSLIHHATANVVNNPYIYFIILI